MLAKPVLPMLALVAAQACEGPSGPAGLDGRPLLTASAPELPGDACPTGGTRWEFGVDLDGDGSLDDAEVRSGFTQCDVRPGSCEVTEVDGGRRIDCADGTSATVRDGLPGDEGESGYPVLVLVEPEPRGERCAIGGSRILAGPDRDRDGRLSESETTSTAYICHGLDPDAHMLTRLDPENPGESCALGGVAVRVGLDADEDAVLDDVEIEVTFIVCHGEPWQLAGVVEGDVRIVNSIDAALLEGATEITGELVVDGRLLTTVDLPSLVEVGGRARFWAADLTHLGLPAVTTFRDDFLIDAPLETLDVTSLADVAGVLAVVRTHLPDLGIDSLASGPGGELDVLANDSLTRLPDLPQMQPDSGGFFFIRLTANTALASTPAVPTLDLAAEIEVVGNDVLGDLSGFGSATRIGLLRVEENASLTNLGLPNVTQISQLHVVDNPSLPQCLVDELIAQLDPPPNVLEVGGNDELATCD